VSNHGLGYRWSILYVVVGVLIIFVVGFSLEGYIRFHNDRVCQAVLGPGAQWDSGTDCLGPPVHENGLM
jgi:hypothetical protein